MKSASEIATEITCRHFNTQFQGKHQAAHSLRDAIEKEVHGLLSTLERVNTLATRIINRNQGGYVGDKNDVREIAELTSDYAKGSAFPWPNRIT